jgi:flavin-dependent dehydrogenase
MQRARDAMPAVDIPVAIIGGGAASAAAAISLAQSGTAALVVAPEPRQEARIGESMGSAGEDLLAALGLRERFLAGVHRPAQAFFSAWGAPVLLRRPHAPGWVLDRSAFDHMLDTAARETGIPRVAQTVRRAERQDAVWSLTLGNGATIHARFLLDCSGRAAVIGRRQVIQTRIDRMVAWHVLLDQRDPGVTPTAATVVESARNGWWYATLLPSGRALLAWFTDPAPGANLDNPEGWRSWLRDSWFVGSWLASAGFGPPGPPRVAPAGTLLLARAAGEGWAAAGDAAAAFDPLSSHGIVSALWMGRQAALSAVACTAGDSAPLAAYADAVARGVAGYQRQRIAMYARERRFPDSPFWTARSQSGACRGGR